MFGHKKTFIISIPGVDQETKREIEKFLFENDINAKVIPASLDVKEF